MYILRVCTTHTHTQTKRDANDMMTMTTTMKEIPFLQHFSPIPLSSRESGAAAAGVGRDEPPSANGGAPSPRCYKVAVAAGSNTSAPRGGNGTAFGLTLCDTAHVDVSVNNSEEAETRRLSSMLASELAIRNNKSDDGDYNKISLSATKSSPAGDISDDELTTFLRGLSSTTYSELHDTIICTNGVIPQDRQQRGWKIRVTSREANLNTGVSSDTKGDRHAGGRDVLLDISSLLHLNHVSTNSLISMMDRIQCSFKSS